MRREYETIIIGGGVIGNSIAYHLSDVGQEGILVLDQNYPLSGTSGSTLAWVWVHTKTPVHYGELSSYSAELYRYLERRIGDIEFRATGGLSPFFTEAERTRAFKLAEAQLQAGIEIKVLGRDELLSMEPALTPKVLGATYCSLDGNVNPFRLLEMYMKAAKRNGVTYEYYNKVLNVEKKQGSFIVTASKGIYTAKNVVISAGVWSKEIGNMLGIDIPVRPVRGQIIVTEPLAPLLNYTLSEMRQTSNGEILIGYSKEDVGLDRSSTLDVIQETADAAIRMIPCLKKAKIVRAFSGIRVMPRDEFPILGRVPGINNLYLAVMHSGITLNPLVGTLITELLTEGETSLPIEPYNIDRFA